MPPILNFKNCPKCTRVMVKRWGTFSKCRYLLCVTYDLLKLLFTDNFCLSVVGTMQHIILTYLLTIYLAPLCHCIMNELMVVQGETKVNILKLVEKFHENLIGLGKQLNQCSK